jgi:hypothetical protein
MARGMHKPNVLARRQREFSEKNFGSLQGYKMPGSNKK